MQKHLGINDEEYKINGATIKFFQRRSVLEKSDIILKVNCPSEDEDKFNKK